MYKTLLTLFLASSFWFGSHAQWVNIPDANFRNKLINLGYGSCFNGTMMDTTCSLVVNATSLDVSSSSILDLEGLQFFDNLIFLDCTYNILTELPTLPGSLRELSCGNNSITSLSTIPDSLQILQFEHNLVDTLPMLPNTLIHLNCSSNSLQSLPSLPSTLTHLGCGKNHLASLPFLPNSLNVILCNGNQLTTLPPLPTSLFIFYCNNNQLSALPSLPDTLTELVCDNNQLTALPPLPNSLWSLYCDSNQLTTLPDLPNSLIVIHCQNNLIYSLPKLPLNLNSFVCNDNPNLFCMPQLNKITFFTFFNTNITCLPNYPQSNTYSAPPLDSIPLCDYFNSNNCPIYWNIAGATFLEEDNNCLKDMNESSYPNLKVKLYQNGNLEQEVFTNSDGSYSFDVSSFGTYTYSVDSANLPFSVSCPTAGFHTSVISAADSLDFSMDFGLECRSGFDLGIQSITRKSGQFFPANYANISIDGGDMINFYGAMCAAGTGGTVRAVLSGPFSYAGSAGSLDPTYVNGDTVEWQVADFGAINFFTAFGLQMQTDTLAQAGQTVCVTVTLSPDTVGDFNLNNNTLSMCWTVVNSYDPNIKEVFPTGEIAHSTEWLTYTIHFQNTGNAPAEHIYIEDTIDTNLDISSFQLLAYSHENLTQLFAPQRRVRFSFPNINLPDSTNNEPESHGYIQYKIKRLLNLPPGTPISNTASIYFDFNPPIVTNTVTNNICTAVNEDFFATTCQGQPYYFKNQWLSTSGNYSDTLRFLNQCDSIRTLHLTVLPANSSTLQQQICEGSSYSFYGQTLSASGAYQHILQNQQGCDSVVTLQLQVLLSDTAKLQQQICEGSSYSFYGQTLNASGAYQHILQTQQGCDSVVTLHLQVFPATDSVVVATIVQGQTYTLPGGAEVSVAGLYADTLLNSEGCDSIVNTQLSVIAGVAPPLHRRGGRGVRLYPNPNSGTFTVDVPQRTRR
jgi:uncharacterized repeat protein (TIGR01451 family)